MPEYESSTHLEKSDRIVMYMIFMTMVGLTAMLYDQGMDGFGRLSLYATVIAFLPTLWAMAAGHYDKKYRRLAAVHARCVPVAVVTRCEPYYVYKDEATPLGEALGALI